MILIKLYEGWTLKQLASVFWLSEVTWRAIIKYQKLIQKLEEKNKDAWFPFKISEEHIMHARKYLFKHSSRQITIKTLRNYLNEIDVFMNSHFLELDIYWKIYWNTHTKLHTKFQSKWSKNWRRRNFVRVLTSNIFSKKKDIHWSISMSSM